MDNQINACTIGRHELLSTTYEGSDLLVYRFLFEGISVVVEASGLCLEEVKE